jgi:3-deoxy-manno-octulosonate cytidylyltransferase (CMP-KDO synthetase)
LPAFRSKDNIDLDLCFRHVGLYAYKVAFLKDYSNMEVSSLEIAEKLEQLTFLANGFDIHVEIARAATGLGVDTESYLKKLKSNLKNEYY